MKQLTEGSWGRRFVFWLLIMVAIPAAYQGISLLHRPPATPEVWFPFNPGPPRFGPDWPEWDVQKRVVESALALEPQEGSPGQLRLRADSREQATRAFAHSEELGLRRFREGARTNFAELWAANVSAFDGLSGPQDNGTVTDEDVAAAQRLTRLRFARVLEGAAHWELNTTTAVAQARIVTAWIVLRDAEDLPRPLEQPGSTMFDVGIANFHLSEAEEWARRPGTPVARADGPCIEREIQRRLASIRGIEDNERWAAPLQRDEEDALRVSEVAATSLAWGLFEFEMRVAEHEWLHHVMKAGKGGVSNESFQSRWTDAMTRANSPADVEQYSRLSHVWDATHEAMIHPVIRLPEYSLQGYDAFVAPVLLAQAFEQREAAYSTGGCPEIRFTVEPGLWIGPRA